MPKLSTLGGSITVQLVSSLLSLDSVVSVHTNHNIFSCLTKYFPVKLDTRHTYSYTSPMVSPLWPV